MFFVSLPFHEGLNHLLWPLHYPRWLSLKFIGLFTSRWTSPLMRSFDVSLGSSHDNSKSILLFPIHFPEDFVSPLRVPFLHEFLTKLRRAPLSTMSVLGLKQYKPQTMSLSKLSCCWGMDVNSISSVRPSHAKTHYELGVMARKS